MIQDRVGLGWRGPLAAATLERMAELDVVEVIAEDWTEAPRREREALAALAACSPVVLHGVSLGLASREPADRKRLGAMARLVDRVRPEAWSEHLAFVRAGGTEIGHLAAPPRTRASVAGAVANLELARRLVGSAPRVENIATLIDPPVSEMGEAEWIRSIVEEAGTPMLLDLHNLYANALNFGGDPASLLEAMPIERVEMVHLAGGRWITAPSGKSRLLDDHLHEVPGTVFDLLEELAARATRDLTVIVERDGNFPEFDALLGEVARARASLARGRARQALADRRAA